MASRELALSEPHRHGHGEPAPTSHAWGAGTSQPSSPRESQRLQDRAAGARRRHRGAQDLAWARRPLGGAPHSSKAVPPPHPLRAPSSSRPGQRRDRPEGCAPSTPSPRRREGGRAPGPGPGAERAQGLRGQQRAGGWQLVGASGPEVRCRQGRQLQTLGEEEGKEGEGGKRGKRGGGGGGPP